MLEELDCLICDGTASRAEVAFAHFDHTQDDEGQINSERDIEFAINENETAQLQSIEEALKRITQGLPLMTLKMAATLDGRTATASGESRWITGPQARRAVHALRLTHDAVLVGAGTARADDPDLTVRDMGATRQPVRIVIDAALSHAPDSKLGRSAQLSPVWLLHGPAAPQGARKAWEATGAKLIELPASPHISPRSALQALAARGITRVLCEGGATLAALMVADDLVDRVVLHTAGALIGAEGAPVFGPLRLTQLSDATRWKRLSLRELGGDVETIWQRLPA